MLCIIWNFSETLSISSRDNKERTETDDGSDGLKREVNFAFRFSLNPYESYRSKFNEN